MTKEEKKDRWELLKTTELMVQKTIDDLGYDPLELSFGSHKKVWFKCSECDYEWLSNISDRTRTKLKCCPKCFVENRSEIYRKKLLKIKKPIIKTNPELCKTLVNKEDGNLYTAGSNKKLLWKCTKCDHEWLANISNRVKGSGCPSCKGLVVTNNNCLKNKCPSLYKELKSKEDGLKYTIGSKVKLWWICSECNYEWKARVNNRYSNNSGCPECSRKNHSENCRKGQISGKKLLYETHPDLCKELVNIKYSFKYTPGSHTKVFWKCSECGYEWKSAIKSRTKGRGCPNCYGNFATKNNCMFITNPALCKELKNKEDAFKYKSKSDKKVWWKCSNCSREWKARIHDRTKGHGCICGKKGRVGIKEQEFINNFVKHIYYFSFKKDKKGLYKGQQYIVPFLKTVNSFNVAFIDFAIKHPKLSRIFLVEYDENRHKYNIESDTDRQKSVYNKLKCKYDQVSIIRIPETDENKLEFVIDEFYKFLNDKDYEELVEYPKDIWNIEG